MESIRRVTTQESPFPTTKMRIRCFWMPLITALVRPTFAVLGSSTDTSNFLEALKLVTEPQSGITKSTSALGVIDMQVSLANANFSGLFTGLNSGLGNFFIGEGEGAVRIDYDVNNDSLQT